MPPAAKPKGRKPGAKVKTVDSRDFVRSWMKHDNVKEIADELGLTKSAVSGRGKKMRERGIDLPERNGMSATKDDLNALIAELTSK